MARPLRIEFAGGLYHVTSRGDRREDIFFGGADRRVWLELLGGVCERFNWVCHADCQMSNHYHVVVETPEGNLSKGMRQLNGVYTQYVNRTYRRVGHVFQGRYRAIVVEKEGYPAGVGALRGAQRGSGRHGHGRRGLAVEQLRRDGHAVSGLSSCGGFGES